MTSGEDDITAGADHGGRVPVDPTGGLSDAQLEADEASPASGASTEPVDADAGSPGVAVDAEAGRAEVDGSADAGSVEVDAAANAGPVVDGAGPVAVGTPTDAELVEFATTVNGSEEDVDARIDAWVAEAAAAAAAAAAAESSEDVAARLEALLAKAEAEARGAALRAHANDAARAAALLADVEAAALLAEARANEVRANEVQPGDGTDAQGGLAVADPQSASLKDDVTRFRPASDDRPSPALPHPAGPTFQSPKLDSPGVYGTPRPPDAAGLPQRPLGNTSPSASNQPTSPSALVTPPRNTVSGRARVVPPPEAPFDLFGSTDHVVPAVSGSASVPGRMPPATSSTDPLRSAARPQSPESGPTSPPVPTRPTASSQLPASNQSGLAAPSGAPQASVATPETVTGDQASLLVPPTSKPIVARASVPVVNRPPGQGSAGSGEARPSGQIGAAGTRSPGQGGHGPTTPAGRAQVGQSPATSSGRPMEPSDRAMTGQNPATTAKPATMPAVAGKQMAGEQAASTGGKTAGAGKANVGPTSADKVNENKVKTDKASADRPGAVKADKVSSSPAATATVKSPPAKVVPVKPAAVKSDPVATVPVKSAPAAGAPSTTPEKTTTRKTTTPKTTTSETTAPTTGMSPERRRRLRRTAVLATVAAVVIVGVAAGIAVRARSQPSGPPPAAGPAIAPAGSVLNAYPTDAPMPTAAGLAAALANPLKQANLGTHVSVEVADMATGKLLFSHGGTSPTTPASTMKLATTISVLATRGPNYRITTRVVAGAKPGEVVLIGAGDPTLAATSNPTYPESGSIQQLADQVKLSLGPVKPTKVIIDTSLYSGPSKGPGWQDTDVESQYLTRVFALATDGGRIHPANRGDSPRYLDSATSAGKIFAKYLGLPATAVTSGIAPKTPATTTSATTPGALLGSVQSAPLVRIIENMLSNSDNMLAEAMARQVAIATGHPASFAGAAAAVIQELTKLGMPMAGVHIVDGSGISHQDRLTPALLAAVLAYAAKPDHPEMHGMFTGLPVAAYSGTLLHRFKHAGTTNADGMIRAKTGTLDGVSALAGFVIDDSGRPLIMVVMLDKAPWTGAPAAIDKIGAAIRACGCGSPPN